MENATPYDLAQIYEELEDEENMVKEAPLVKYHKKYYTVAQKLTPKENVSLTMNELEKE